MGKNKIFQIIKNEIDSILLITIFSLSFLSILTLHFKLDTASSVFFKMIFGFIGLWFVIRLILFLKQKPKEKLTFDCKMIIALSGLSILSLTISVLVSYIANKTNPTFNSLSYFVVLIFSILTLLLVMYGKFNNIIFKVLIVESVLLSLIFLITFATGYSREWSGVKSFSGLTSNFSNPNLAGIILSTLAIIIIYSIFAFKNKVLKYSLLVFAGIDVVLLIFTSARTPLLACGCAVIGIVIYFLFRKHNLNLPISIAVVLAPLIFIGLYLLIFSGSLNGSISSGVTNEGKDASSRLFIWVQQLKQYSASPRTILFGDYLRLQINSHNSILTLLSSYGLFSTLLCLSLMAFALYHVTKDIAAFDINKYYGLFFILFILLLGISESTPIITSNGMFTIFCMAIIIEKECDKRASVYSSYDCDERTK